MASLCKRQQCTIERRGFRQELDSWRHKLIHCVGFESILEGLFGPGLIKDLTLFQDCEPEGVSDWSFDENCLFCCLRREKVKEHLVSLNSQLLLSGDICKQEQSKINRLEKQAEEFLNAVFYRKDIPSFSDPHIPLVAREIMQRMIRQFAAEYTSKTSSSQDTPQPNGTKDQSLPKAPSPAAPAAPPASAAAASAQNPVLSKLLMADQDSPLDLTIKKPDPETLDQDGVLDLSTKRGHNTGGVSVKNSHGCSTAPVVKGRPMRADHNFQDGDEDGPPPRSFQDGTRENYSNCGSLKPPLARSLLIKEGILAHKQRLLQPSISLGQPEVAGLPNHGQHPLLPRDGSSWVKPHLDGLLKLKANSALSDLKDLPLFLENSSTPPKGSAAPKMHETKKEQGHSPPVDLKIPQVRGMDLSWDSHASDLYGYGSLVVAPHPENALSKKLRAILPKQHRRGALGGILDGSSDFWGSDVEQSTSGQQYPTSDAEGDPSSKQPRKKRGRYRQYNSEILEEAISVVMNGKMSVSKAQNIYGIPHSTLEYKVKERLGTLKNPPKKKMKLMRMEGQDSAAEADPAPKEEEPQGASETKDE